MMRRGRIGLTAVLVIGGVTAQGAAAEEYRGTMEQQMACTPDVWRLCSDQIPDVNRIVACLRQNTPQLSNGCRAVFETNNQAPPQPPVPRGRTAPPRYDTAPPPEAAPPPRPYDDD